MSRRRLRNAGWVVFFLAPSAVPLLAFTIVPMITSAWVSLHAWNLIKPMTWVGLDNYRHLLSDPATRDVFWHTLLYVAGYLPLVYVGGLGLALALNRRMPAQAFFRAAYFLPVVTSWVVVALVWKWLLNPGNGLVNHLLGAVGLGQPGWWTDPGWAMASVILASAWKDLGFVMVILLAGAVVMLFPFLWTVVTSITPEGSLAGGPTLFVKNPTLAAYRTLLETLPMWRIVANSLWVAVVSTLLQLVTGSMAAYGFARLKFRGKGVVFALYLATLMVPMQVLVVPLFIEMKTLNLQDTYMALLAPSIASAFGVFLLRQAVESVPRELDEAATIDGAGHLRIFLTIIVPLIRPALATVAVFAFMGSWNSFLWPLVVIRSPEFMTLPLGLATLQGQFTTQWDVVMAGSVFSILPIAVVYLLAQRHIIAGVAHTGIK
jgi:multiple sugar transport system permease protein